MNEIKSVSLQTRRKFIKRTVEGMAAGVCTAVFGLGATEARAQTLSGDWTQTTGERV